MRPPPPSSGFNRTDENFEQFRRRMLADTSRFIEWGLKHPDKVEWIPRHRVGASAFPERVKAIFWNLVFANRDMPE
jgi:hypothetical protein